MVTAYVNVVVLKMVGYMHAHMVKKFLYVRWARRFLRANEAVLVSSLKLIFTADQPVGVVWQS